MSQNVLIAGRPMLTATRAAVWLTRCALRLPVEVAIERDGPVMRLEPRLRRFGSTSLFMKRMEYEPELSFLATLIKPGAVVIDVGANFGVYSLVLASRAGYSGRVFAFEPGTEALRQLRVNCDLNPTLNVQVVPCGLSDAVGAATLFHVGGPVTFSLAGGDTESGEPVRVTTLDRWMSKTALPRVDFIKVDVEGHEPHVFAGAQITLGSQRPLVMFEVSASALARGGHRPSDPWDQLLGAGYDIYRLSGADLVPLCQVEEGNLFAVHPHSDWHVRLRDRLRS